MSYQSLWQRIQYFDQNWVYASDKSSFIHKLVSQTIRTILINGWASRSPKAVPSVSILYTSYFLLLLLLIETHFFLHLCLQENMVTLIRALEVEMHQSTVSADGFYTKFIIDQQGSLFFFQKSFFSSKIQYLEFEFFLRM